MLGGLIFEYLWPRLKPERLRRLIKKKTRSLVRRKLISSLSFLSSKSSDFFDYWVSIRPGLFAEIFFAGNLKGNLAAKTAKTRKFSLCEMYRFNQDYVIFSIYKLFIRSFKIRLPSRNIKSNQNLSKNLQKYTKVYKSIQNIIQIFSPAILKSNKETFRG